MDLTPYVSVTSIGTSEPEPEPENNVVLSRSTSVPLSSQKISGVGTPLAAQERENEPEMLTFRAAGCSDISGATVQKRNVRQVM